ncbi:MAG: methyltransferase domain-containing protein [Nitrososphaerales archaeon]
MKTRETSDAFQKVNPTELHASATLQMANNVMKILHQVKNVKINKMLDMGCAYGSLTKLLADHFRVQEAYGIDIDVERLQEAKAKGISTVKINLENEALPFADNYFDLVTSFGMLEHLTYLDNVMAESYRVLKKNGYLLITVPNLASYRSRFELLFGYQPRDVEVSKNVAVGIYNHKHYLNKVLNHVHTVTPRALKQLLNHYNFSIVAEKGGSPYQRSHWIKLLDQLFAFKPSLARRLIILARK